MVGSDGGSENAARRRLSASARTAVALAILVALGGAVVSTVALAQLTEARRDLREVQREAERDQTFDTLLMKMSADSVTDLSDRLSSLELKVNSGYLGGRVWVYGANVRPNPVCVWKPAVWTISGLSC